MANPKVCILLWVDDLALIMHATERFPLVGVASVYDMLAYAFPHMLQTV